MPISIVSIVGSFLFIHGCRPRTMPVSSSPTLASAKISVSWSARHTFEKTLALDALSKL
jgi:hypothetical protein